MDQVKFLWLAKNIPGISITQGDKGRTVVTLRPKIEIIHDALRMNKMEIFLKDDKSRYIIPDTETLKEIYDMHVNNIELMYQLHSYCEKNLEIVK